MGRTPQPGPLLAAIAAALVLCCGPPSPGFDLSGVEDLDGRSVDPFDGTGPGTVLIFARSDCPISNRYAPEIRRIADRYADAGVRFWLVYADVDDTAERIREHMASFSYTRPAIRDRRHALVRAAGARVTPEAAVFDRERSLIYAGRIDDRYVAFGKRRAEPTVRDLVDALDALLEGRRPATSRTDAVGCTIAPLR